MVQNLTETNWCFRMRLTTTSYCYLIFLWASPQIDFTWKSWSMLHMVQASKSVYKALTWFPLPTTLELECFSERQCSTGKRSLSTLVWLILLANLTRLGGKNLSWRIVSIFRNTCGNIFLIAIWGRWAQSTVGGPIPRLLGLDCIKGDPVSSPVNRGPLWFLL